MSTLPHSADQGSPLNAELVAMTLHACTVAQRAVERAADGRAAG